MCQITHNNAKIEESHVLTVNLFFKCRCEENGFDGNLVVVCRQLWFLMAVYELINTPNSAIFNGTEPS